MVTGKVISQAIAIREIMPYLSPAPEATMVPAMPEVTMCVVLTGKPVNPAVPISNADTNSAEAP